MNDDSTLSAVRNRLTEVRDALGDVQMSIPVSEIVAKGRRRRTGRVLAAAAACAAVAVGIAVPLAAGIGSQPAAARTVIRLASHTFRMPAGYRLAAATSSCHAFAVYMVPSSGVPLHAKGVFQNPPYETEMKAAASASGGCILLALAPRYTPTAAIPDPEALTGAHPVHVGRYRGLISHSSVFLTGIDRRAAEHGIRPGWSRLTQLFVRLPAGGGQMRDLVIGASQLSDAALIRIAAHGLSSGRVARG